MRPHSSRRDACQRLGCVPEPAAPRTPIGRSLSDAGRTVCIGDSDAPLGAARRQVGVDKVRLKGRLRVTLPLFDELPCIAGIQVAFGVWRVVWCRAW
jgi:hypothetical protein